MKRSFLVAAFVLTAAIAVAESDRVVVCSDAEAGAYEAFPDVCRLSDGRLLSVFYAGYGHVSLPNDSLPKGGRVSGCYSSDEGKTWSAPFVVYDSPDDDRDPSVAQLSDGKVVCTFFSLRKKEGGKWDGLGSFIIDSADGGKTWSTPRQISADYYCSSPIREMPDKTLIIGLYRASDKDANGAVSISTDMGKTWGKPIDIDNGGQRLDAETDVIRLKDGRLYAAQRAEQVEMRYSISEDQGKIWSISKPMGFEGHCPYLYRAPGDIIICAHRKPNTSLHYSLDECKTWSANIVVDDVYHGAYPSLVTLKDDTSLIVYYEERDKSDIIAKKFKATPKGIEWLKFD